MNNSKNKLNSKISSQNQYAKQTLSIFFVCITQWKCSKGLSDNP